MTNSSETLVSFYQTAEHHNTKYFLVTAMTVLDPAEPVLLMIQCHRCGNSFSGNMHISVAV
jgi:hypothetical protein